MRKHSPELDLTAELTPEEQMFKYEDLLLHGPNGDRVAVAEHLLPPDAEPGVKVAKAEFYKKDGGYYIVEYRDHSSDPSFTTYMRPVEQIYTSDLPESAKWATGMIRHRWSRFSEREIDQIEPVLGVVKAFFGELPT
jgi:hypothetical protein